MPSSRSAARSRATRRPWPGRSSATTCCLSRSRRCSCSSRWSARAASASARSRRWTDADAARLGVGRLSRDRMTVTINHYLVVSLLLFAIGFFGVLARRNFLTILMSIELMLNAVNLNLIAFSRRLSDLTGQVFSVFVIAIAAGEAAIGLALTISLFRQRKTLNVEEADTMRG